MEPGGRDGGLLTHDLKQGRAVQIHWWKLRQPGLRIEVRAGVDESRHDGVPHRGDESPPAAAEMWRPSVTSDTHSLE